jgi:tetratricopeptide (TPR) repeat protein
VTLNAPSASILPGSELSAHVIIRLSVSLRSHFRYSNMSGSPNLLSKAPTGRLKVSLLALFAALVMVGCGELKSATEYLIAGNEAFKRSDYKQAEIEYRNAIKLEPKSSTALNNLGVILNELGKYDDAVEILNKAIAVDPKNCIAHYTLSQSLIKKEQYPQAIIEARKAVELKNDEVGGHKALALASLMLGKKEQNKETLKVAVDEYHFILQSDNDDDSAHRNLGEALAAMDDKDSALVEVRKAVELNPDNLSARKLLAALLQEKGDKAEAGKQLDVIIQKDPADSEARKLKAQL